MKIDKEAPKVTHCSADISVLLSINDMRTSVSWEEPMFTDNTGIVDIKQTHMSGHLFTFGEYHVTYMAFDAEGNTAVCRFKIFVSPQHCRLPATPHLAVKQCNTWDKGVYCTVSCADPIHYDFPEKPPVMYICGPEGMWDPPRGKHFVIPPCAGFTLPSSKMKGSLIITGPVCSEDHRISLHAELKAQLQGYQLCQGTDCDYDYIIVDCIHPENIKRNIEPAKYSIQFDIPANTSALTEGLLETAINEFQSFIKEMGGFVVTNQSFDISLHCEAGQVLRDNKRCVNCGIGYYFESDHCELCPLGTYTDQERQLSCTSCPEGETTLTIGAYKAGLCYKLCTAGEYMLDGVCEPCEAGFYQDEEGQTSCKPCPLGQSTQDSGASSERFCTDICGYAGVELTVDGDCRPCERGFYKSESSQITCDTCPLGYTTLASGATHIGMCSYVICKQGEYRTENNSCDQCPIGTYQPNGSDETCYWCPLGHTTLQPGSMSVQDCVTGAVDECSTSLHDCSDHSVCVDRPEGYSCECEIGYSKVESKCIDNCESLCVHGRCVKDETGNPSCFCDDGYQGLDCSDSAGLSSAAVAGIVSGITVFICIIMLGLACFIKRSMFKRGEKLVAKVHRCEHSSDFRAYAIAINPTFEMSSERSTSMRQVTTSHMSRQRTSRGEVSQSSGESYF